MSEHLDNHCRNERSALMSGMPTQRARLRARTNPRPSSPDRAQDLARSRLVKRASTSTSTSSFELHPTTNHF
ncbi:hypothetical protein PPTG_24192 [Phytophthora nicotianae INRA-310]|uniref:Uncharacterized protein n=1 Tax=Phytophthora nicotianae (strain INRA-310) TaxID=761204 RepID=W2PKT3_PHYN3|nr:hypothetical protein PPTG_24192 [Phytophthora nicotianae INRA-310]ETN00839.1 hypothetical protein PPTG_24192 [Phytophthora nicotianae INRA-310]